MRMLPETAQSLESPAPIAADTASHPGRATRSLRPKILPILLVLIAGFPFVLNTLTFPLLKPLLALGVSFSIVSGINAVIYEVILTVAILAIVRYWERLPLRSIGLAWPNLIDIGLGLGLLVLMFLADDLTLRFILPLLTSPAAASQGVTAIDRPQVNLLEQMPTWLSLLIAIGAGISEELWARGYGIERLQAVTRSTFVAGAVMLGLDLLMHVPFWGFRYTVIIAPSQLLLLGMYLWQHRLAPGILAHTLMDAARPILISAMMLFATALPNPTATGWTYMQRGNYDVATIAFDAALKRNPKDTSALQGRADAYWYKGNYAQSVQDLTTVVKLEPTNERAWWNRANSYYAMHDYPRALADANKAVALAPDDGGTYSLRSDIEQAMGKPDEAANDRDKATSIEAPDSAKLQDAAALAANRGEYNEAIADVTRAISIDPHNRLLLLFREMVYAEDGQFLLAADDLKTFFASKPNDPLMLVLDSDLSYRQHDYGTAVALISRAISADRENSGFYARRATFYLKAGKSNLARADLRHVLQTTPKDAEDYNRQAWILATCPLDDIRNGARAIQLATQACKLYGWKNAQYLDTLAAAYAELGDFKTAISWEKKAIAALSPMNTKDREDMRERLGLYQAGHPYRDTDPES